MRKKSKHRWKKRVVLGALAAGGAYAVVKTRNAYHGIMTMVENKNDDERKIMEKFARSYHYIGSDELFTGATVGAVCCSLRLEMQNARIEKDCEIELGCLMSSVVIFVPEQIHVVVDVEMKAGFTRWTIQNGLMPDADGPTLYIHGTAHMSSVLVQTLPANAEAPTPEKTPARAASETAEDTEQKEFAEETLPSGGPITDDEPEDTIRVIHIADLDDENEDAGFDEPEARTSAAVEPVAEPAAVEEPAQEPAATEAPAEEPAVAVEPVAETAAVEEPAQETAATEAPAEEPAVADEPKATEKSAPEYYESDTVRVFDAIFEEAKEERVTEEKEPVVEPAAAEAPAEEPPAEEPAVADEPKATEKSDPEYYEGDTVRAFDAIFEEAEKAFAQAADNTAADRAEHDEDESAARDLDEEDETSEAFDEDDFGEEDLDEDDDFAGEDKRKRLSQDKIDAILDRLADEYEKRGGEE